MYNKRSICAGVMIGLAGLLYLYLGGALGALAFGLGLLAVCALKLDLFTGKMRAFWNGEISLAQLGITLLGNIVGILFTVGVAVFLHSSEHLMCSAQAIMTMRSGLPFGVIFMRAVLCGICVQMAVDMWRQGLERNDTHPFLAMLPATAFVLLGCNHCIADTLYLVYSGAWGQTLQIFEALAGNFIGATLFVIASSGIPSRQDKTP